MCIHRVSDGEGKIEKATSVNITVVEGDLLDQDVDVIVNAWNRNIIPWWLLLPLSESTKQLLRKEVDEK